MNMFCFALLNIRKNKLQNFKIPAFLSKFVDCLIEVVELEKPAAISPTDSNELL